jgi:hypothetical protein
VKTITTATQNAWVGQVKGGATAPYMRATIQKMNIHLYGYALQRVRGSRLTGHGDLASMLFTQTNRPIELPNIKSITWNRSIDSDVATCTLTLWNTEILPLGQTPEDGDVQALDQPGYFTYNRGATEEGQTLWDYAKNGWRDMLVPDRIIKTWEGYGFDAAAVPELDENMYQSGTWLIDEVEYTSGGEIKVECRDLGRALLDQIMFPPVIPWARYPLMFSKRITKARPNKYVSNPGTKWVRPTYTKDSNLPYIGQGFTDGGRPYVDSNGAVRGHHGSHAFDSSTRTYWLSVGNYPNWSSAYEWVQGKFSSRTIDSVKVRSWGGPYTIYISVYGGGRWRGSGKIPYKARAVDAESDINFVVRSTIGEDEEKIFRLPKKIRDMNNITSVRITLHDLKDTGIGQYKYRGGIRDVQVTSQPTSISVDQGSYTIGDYDDYTDVVKWLLGWGGFYWPTNQQIGASGQTISRPTWPKYVISDGSTVTLTPGSSDPVFNNAAKGRIWGDLEQTGTAGTVDLSAEQFDKLPLMDGISKIRDIVNYVFFIDEWGGAVWRSPNIWKKGNYLSNNAGGPNTGRTTSMVTIDENTTLLSLSAKVSSRNVRERVFVANTTGREGAVSVGFNPFPSGLRRVGGWTDQNFDDAEECQIMADLVTLRQSFQYRKDGLTIPGNPAIQIDDQIKIVERTTGETYIHYVNGITSTWDATTRKWTYELQTNWLGENPFDRWFFDPSQLAEETRRYLGTIGKI